MRIRQIGYIDHSWRLVATDAIPTSKRKGEALRDLEKKIQGAKYEEIDLYAAQHITVAEYVQKSLGYKIHYKQTTKNTRRVYFKIVLRIELEGSRYQRSNIQILSSSTYCW